MKDFGVVQAGGCDAPVADPAVRNHVFSMHLGPAPPVVSRMILAETPESGNRVESDLGSK